MDFPFSAIYNNVKNNCKGGKNMRKLYIDNIRWITVVLVVCIMLFICSMELKHLEYRTIFGCAVSGCISVYRIPMVYAVVVCNIRNERKV